MQRIRDYLFGSVFRRGATLLTSLTLASYALGLVRDMVFSRVLGAGRLLDVYNAAFIIPDVLLNVFIAGALAAAFVPVFTHLAAAIASDRKQLAGTMLAAAPVVMVVIGAIAFVAMPHWQASLLPGSGPDRALLVRLSRLLLLSPILFAVSNTLGGVLVSLERFVGYGLSPVLYNLGIIGGAFLVEPLGPIGLVIGTLAGAALHLLSRVVAILRSEFRPHGPVTVTNPHFRQVVRLMIPRMAGQPVEQLTFFLFTNLASSLAVGSIAMLAFARNFQSVPVSIFGISFATAVFASLSRSAALNDDDAFVRTLAKPRARSRSSPCCQRVLHYRGTTRHFAPSRRGSVRTRAGCGNVVTACMVLAFHSGRIVYPPVGACVLRAQRHMDTGTHFRPGSRAHLGSFPHVHARHGTQRSRSLLCYHCDD